MAVNDAGDVLTGVPRVGSRVYYGWVVLAVAALAMVGTLPGRTQGPLRGGSCGPCSVASRWTTAGVAIGIPCALLAARIARGLLFGLSATNGSVVTIAVAVMGLMGLLAAYLPARRASRIDPLLALRGD